MSLPRTYRGFVIDYDLDTPLAERWTASHPDYEDPAYEDGRPLVLREVDERELQIAIDDYLFDGLTEYEVCFGNPRKSMQSVYVVRAEDAAEATAQGKRMAKADRIPQAYWNTVEKAA